MKKIDLNKTRFGRILRRLAGENKGAVMMEYVMLGVLIAAACVGAAYMLSSAFRDGMTTMATAVVGGGQNNVTSAASQAQSNQSTNKSNAQSTHDAVTGEGGE